MPDSRIPGLFVVAGLVGAAAAAPPPEPELAQLQLRALNHRVIVFAPDSGGELIERLTHTDFVFTRSDGAWLPRTEFVRQLRQRGAVVDAQLEDEPVRLFGPVALVHGVYTSPPVLLRYTDVYLWGGSGWQLISAQDSPLKEGVTKSLVAGPTATLPSWQGQDPVGDEHAVLMALNERYVQSFREADVAWYDAHLAPDYVVISSDGSYRDRAAALSDFARPVFAQVMKSFPVSRVQIRRFGDVALIHATNIYETKDGRSGENRYTDIWHRLDGRWRCIAAHITTYKAPAPPPR